MQELCNISHNRPFIRLINIYILRIQKPCDSQLSLSDIECMLQPLPVGLPLHLRQVNQVRFDGVDYSQESDTISP